MNELQIPHGDIARTTSGAAALRAVIERAEDERAEDTGDGGGGG
jgi:hypothetical protein